jgi:hypothetical protein
VLSSASMQKTTTTKCTLKWLDKFEGDTIRSHELPRAEFQWLLLLKLPG